MTAPGADTAHWSLVAASDFVSLATFRKNGEPVATPVWIAADGEDLVVTTEINTGKVKRLRNDTRVTMQPCSRMGKVEPDAPVVTAVGSLDASAAGTASADAALRAKYGVQFRLILGFERLVRRLQRKPGQRVIVRISPAK